MTFRPGLRVAAAMLAAGLLVGCSARPGPAPVVEPEPEPTATTTTTTTTTSRPPSATRTSIGAGVEPLRNGLNPHLVGDSMATVESIADLVLPSAFWRGQMDTNLLVSAEEIDGPAAQTVRYVISPAAQWSDGTPITGADFIYLWRALTTTPGVVDPAGYLAISDIRTSDGGKTVDVDFHQRVDDFRPLFHHLLPSHLAEADASDFATAYFATIPASGGRYMVANVDRARGMITLHRNDRFWGHGAADTDVLSLKEVDSVNQGVDLLRTGQISYLDVVPEETSVAAYELLPDTQVRLVDGPGQLQLTFSVTSDILSAPEARAEFAGLIDVPFIARQAAGRSANLAVPEHIPPNGQPLTLLQEATGGQPLRIAADPADEQASAAARTLVNVLARAEVDAELVSTDLIDVAGRRLPAGDVDAVVAWSRDDGTRPTAVSPLLCPADPEDPRLRNFSGFCAPETQEALSASLAGELDAEQTEAILRGVNQAETLVVPLLDERRVVVLGQGIVGPDPDLNAWTTGLGAASTWKRQEP